MKKLHLVKLKNTPIFKQLQYEEALVRTDSRNWCLFNEGSTEAVVMGISGKPELLIDESRLYVPVIRRFTGGGTVLVDADTCFVTLVCNHADVNVQPFPRPILKWNGEIYRDHFQEGYEVLENDYVLHGQKFGGNAQYITKDRWLHHTSHLWDYDPKKMEVLKMPPKVPAYRNQRDHREFLCKLNPYFPSKEDFFYKASLFLSKFFYIQEASEEELIQCLHKPHRKATQYL